MTFVTFLNELSFPTGTRTDSQATAAVIGLVRTLEFLKTVHSDVALHSPMPIAQIPMGQDRWLGPMMAAGPARDDWRYIRGFQNRSPFTVGIGQAFGMETEYRHAGITAEGLGLSHAHGTLAVSFPSAGWMQSSIDLERLHMDDLGTIDQEIVTVVHAAHPDHVVEREDEIRSAPLVNIVDGVHLWASKEDLFPHLKFLPRVENQLRDFLAGDVVLRSAAVALMDLELAVAAWDVGTAKFPDFRTRTSGEGETRARKFWFADLSGVQRLFDMHTRYTPGAGRVHFWCDRTNGTATIAHVGEKVPD